MTMAHYNSNRCVAADRKDQKWYEELFNCNKPGMYFYKPNSTQSNFTPVDDPAWKNQKSKSNKALALIKYAAAVSNAQLKNFVTIELRCNESLLWCVVYSAQFIFFKFLLLFFLSSWRSICVRLATKSLRFPSQTRFMAMRVKIVNQ